MSGIDRQMFRCIIHCNYFLQVLAIEFVAIEFVTLAIEFIPLAIEFVALAIEFVTLATKFVTLAIEFVTFARKFVRNKIGSCAKHENKM